MLGAGYTASFVSQLAPARYTRILATSRAPDKNLSHMPSGQRIHFDLCQTETWTNIPGQADLLWCFPAMPLGLIRAFATAAEAETRRLVVLGSTSAYDLGGRQGYPPPWVDETMPIDLTKARVEGEEFLRRECRAIILRVAGIYGPHRHPFEWIKTGRVGASRKFVNLIHVKDVAAACLAALERGTPGEAYNVSDGTPRTWKEICGMAKTRWGVTCPMTVPREETGKRLSNAKLLKELGYTIQYPDLYKALDSLYRDSH